MHNGYLASCGLNVPRLDSVPRTIDFAMEMQRIIERFDTGTGHHLSIRAGVNTGNVISGLVGGASVIYDMWGATVNSGPPDAQWYTESRDLRHLRGVRGDARHAAVHTRREAITVDGSEQPIWRLSERK